MSEGTERHRREENGKNRDGPPPPTFLALAREKWKGQKHAERDYRTNQQSRSLHRRRKQRQYGIEPQEKIIRPGHSLDDGGVGLPARSERAEVNCAGRDREKNKAGGEN